MKSSISSIFLILMALIVLAIMPVNAFLLGDIAFSEFTVAHPPSIVRERERTGDFSRCLKIDLMLGVDVEVLDENLVNITAWLKPLKIDWKTFSDTCYPSFKVNYKNMLFKRIISRMFNVTKYIRYKSGLDEGNKRVYYRILTHFEYLGLSDTDEKVLRFIDPYASEGKGYIDMITVKSHIGIYSINPLNYEEFLCEDSVCNITWNNTRLSEHPILYTINLLPIETGEVILDFIGIPSDKEVMIIVDGLKRYVVKGEEFKIYLGDDEYHRITIVPTIIEEELVRYVCENCDFTARRGDRISIMFHKEYKVSFDSDIKGIKLWIDDQIILGEELPKSFWWREGSTHEISVPEEIPLILTNNTRRLLRFSEWNTGESTTRLVIIIDKPLTLIPHYNSITQYYIDLISDIGSVRGEGWYNEGDLASIVIEGYQEVDGEVIIPVNEHERFVFKGWAGDIVGSNPELIFKVDSPKLIRATWKKQYYVDIVSRFGDIDGEGWYDEGETAWISLDKAVIYSSDERRRFSFTGWTGDYSGDEKSFSIIVDKPLTIIADWLEECLVEFNVNPESLREISLEWSEKWVKCGDEIRIKVEPEIKASEDTRYIFLKLEIKSEEIKEEIYSHEFVFRVNEPKEVIAFYEPLYRVEVISGDRKLMERWCRAGSEIEVFVAPPTTNLLVRNVFEGWKIGSKIISRDEVYKFTVNGPIRLIAVWSADYSGLIILMASIIGSAIIGITMMKKGASAIISKISEKKRKAAKLEKRIRKLEILYEKGEISEGAYRRLMEEYKKKLQNNLE